MNDQPPSADDAHELQFNEAVYSAPNTGGATCTACNQGILDRYFQINGSVLCEHCVTNVKALLTGGASLPRFFKACVYGLAASFAGFLIYFGILKLTGYEIGLISILVGYMVGAAVRNGSGGRGGILYQVIAVGCTYLAIAASHSALMIPLLIAQHQIDKAAPVPPNNVEKAINVQADNAAAAQEQEAEKVAPEPVQRKEVSLFGFIVAISVVFAIMLSLPVVVGIQQPIGLLIMGFALWEAFKMNRKVDIVITGPHNVGRTPDAAPAHG